MDSITFGLSILLLSIAGVVVALVLWWKDDSILIPSIDREAWIKRWIDETKLRRRGLFGALSVGFCFA